MKYNSYFVGNTFFNITRSDIRITISLISFIGNIRIIRTIAPGIVLAFISFSLIASEPLSVPSVSSMQKARSYMGAKEAIPVKWVFEQAPGSKIFISDSQRKLWLPLDGWSKLSIPADEGPLVSGKEISLPDQWPGTRNYNIAWYFFDADFGTDISGSFWIRFEAVAHSCVVYINGKEAGSHLGGFTPFEFDISDFINSGHNTISIWVQDATSVIDEENNKAVSQLGLDRPGEYRSVAGIRGGVYFEKRQPVHLDRNRISTSVRDKEINVETWVRNGEKGDVLSMEVYEWPDGKTPVLIFPKMILETGSPNGKPQMVNPKW